MPQIVIRVNGPGIGTGTEVMRESVSTGDLEDGMSAKLANKIALAVERAEKVEHLLDKKYGSAVRASGQDELNALDSRTA